MLGLLIFLLSISLISCINQQCSPFQPCPSNSQCGSQSGYCICNTGFIGACNVTATLISSNPVDVFLPTSNTMMTYMVPQSLNEYLLFQFNICQNTNQLDLTLSLWGETGSNTQYTASNTLSGPTSFSIGSGCTSVYSPYISFGSQPNGQNQLLILGIQNSDSSTTISISVSQSVSTSLAIYIYVLIAALAVLLISGAIAGGYCIFQRRRRRLRMMGVAHPSVVNIDHFQNFMPIVKAEVLGGQKQTCSICLMPIEKNQFARKTPCGHVFHSACIDSWCLKNVSCPVCRQELDLQSILALQNSRMNQPQVNTNNQTVVQNQVVFQPENKQMTQNQQRQMQLQIARGLFSNNSGIRESML